jgi:bifunctional lysine-specific demethylase and histidyl-hydroxylase MINA
VGFADLIAPTSPEEFFARHWEQRALHVPRATNGATPMFGLRDLDHLLAHMPPTATVKLTRASGDETDSRPAPAGATALPALYRSYTTGNTIIVDGMHALWEPVAQLCRALTAELGMQVQANLYVTPKMAQGFPCHWDGHDVLILQLEGSKTWSVYERDGPLPSPGADGGAHTPAAGPELEVTLAPGHLLYLPRGTPHQARTGDEGSVHLTVGLYAATWENLLVAAVKRMAASDPALRQSLPGRWLDDPAAARAVADRCRWLVDRLTADAHVEQGLVDLAAQVAESAPCLPDGHFSRLEEADHVTADSVVARQPGVFLHASQRPGEAKLAFPGSFVTGPPKLFWAFEHIAGAPQFRVGEIPGWYSEAERVMLARMLVRAGCLRVVERG